MGEKFGGGTVVECFSRAASRRQYQVIRLRYYLLLSNKGKQARVGLATPPDPTTLPVAVARAPRSLITTHYALILDAHTQLLPRSFS